MVRFASFFIVVVAAVGGFCTPLKRTANEIKQDITILTSKASEMASSIDAFVTPDIRAALAVHVANGQVNTNLKQATTHALATPRLELADAQDIVRLLKGNVDVDGRALVLLRTKVNLVKAIPVNGTVALVNGDLITTSKAFSKYIDALKAIILHEDQTNALAALEAKAAADFARTAALFV
ncbi:hypothetical protein PC9H_005940 [Pleurotus ostreatus]|uniref:Uncharacterized protein n=1 Tax=Pleurotus ostreatus TaxID=5322 RepID=A0A8H6ZVA1_PLEOS|nr:uncharacterized protein PC9H_005940 [Pleurotus ostreatus]KAF7430238.1 hypothetical protein PC9H_005940 [Pleurotus ostreatus]KAJ8701324.1 hypothetical protein PTI98_000125 [Pleurotus ostreatus]